MHRVAVARDQAATALLKIAESPEAIVFDIKEPLWVVEWLLPPDWGDGLDTRKLWLQQAGARRHDAAAGPAGIEARRRALTSGGQPFVRW